MSIKVVRWMIAILATIIMLIFLAIVGALVEEGRNIVARVLWILATVFFSAALILRLQQVLLGGCSGSKGKGIGRRKRD